MPPSPAWRRGGPPTCLPLPPVAQPPSPSVERSSGSVDLEAPSSPSPSRIWRWCVLGGCGSGGWEAGSVVGRSDLASPPSSSSLMAWIKWWLARGGWIQLPQQQIMQRRWQIGRRLVRGDWIRLPRRRIVQRRRWIGHAGAAVRGPNLSPVGLQFFSFFFDLPWWAFQPPR